MLYPRVKNIKENDFIALLNQESERHYKATLAEFYIINGKGKHQQLFNQSILSFDFLIDRLIRLSIRNFPTISINTSNQI